MTKAQPKRVVSPIASTTEIICARGPILVHSESTSWKAGLRANRDDSIRRLSPPPHAARSSEDYPSIDTTFFNRTAYSRIVELLTSLPASQARAGQDDDWYDYGWYAPRHKHHDWHRGKHHDWHSGPHLGPHSGPHWPTLWPA
jgi:hypothetical protein